ncbi:MAG TPA: hypothetical protein VGF96_01580 [Terracidiphilus sp.]|jgi:hypothetical protein
MKSKRTLIIAAFSIAIMLGAFPHRASASIEIYLHFPEAASPSVNLSTIASIVFSALPL